MSRRAALGAMLAVGTLTALEAPLNAGLSRSTGSLQAAFVAFCVGGTVVAVSVLASGSVGGLRKVARVPPVYLLGGLCGATFVTVALIAVESVGAGGVAAGAITGQLAAAVLADRLGLLGLRKHHVSVRRLAGVALLLAGTLLVVGA